MSVPADRFTTVLLQQHLSPEWIGTIIGSDKVVIVARTRFPERFVGQKATPDLLQA